MTGARVAATAAMAVASAIVWSEIDAWRASRLHLSPAAAERHGPKTVLVLGYPSASDGSPSWIRRYRAKIALRTYQRGDTVVFCGASLAAVAVRRRR